MFGWDVEEHTANAITVIKTCAGLWSTPIVFEHNNTIYSDMENSTHGNFYFFVSQFYLM